jgi:FAD/FMN-containing dehydrogenase
MDMTSEQLAQDLKQIVGEDHVYTDVFERVNYADTSLPYDVEDGDLPDAVVQPANAQGISEVLKYC